jgi:hypothetical protein
MNTRSTQFGLAHCSAPTAAFAAALLLLSAVGCWQEIRYDPSQEQSEVPAKEVVQIEEVPTEQPTSAPTAEQLFADKPANQEPDLGQEPDQEKPLWNGLESDSASATSAEPAPPAALDWEDDPPQEKQPEPAAAPTPADPRTALAAWRMASKWSLAVGGFGNGRPAEQYDDLLKQANFAAQLLQVQLPPLPEQPSPANRTEEMLLAAATDLLLDGSGPQLAKAVGTEHSDMHRALCDLAIKTHALLLIYKSHGSQQPPLVEEIRLAAKASPLPERLWKPVLESLDAGADFQEVKKSVFGLHAEATQYLGDLVAP